MSAILEIVSRSLPGIRVRIYGGPVYMEVAKLLLEAGTNAEIADNDVVQSAESNQIFK